MSATNRNAMAALAERLTAKARTLATAHAAMRRRKLRNDPGRWRDARALWPLFTKENR